jgi:hypothetical protein
MGLTLFISNLCTLNSKLWNFINSVKRMAPPITCFFYRYWWKTLLFKSHYISCEFRTIGSSLLIFFLCISNQILLLHLQHLKKLFSSAIEINSNLSWLWTSKVLNKIHICFLTYIHVKSNCWLLQTQLFTRCCFFFCLP